MSILSGVLNNTAGTKLHDFSSYSTGEMYDITQTDDTIKHGDLFLCNDGDTIGILVEAWPTVLAGPKGKLESVIAGQEVRFLNENFPGALENITAIIHRHGLKPLWE